MKKLLSLLLLAWGAQAYAQTALPTSWSFTNPSPSNDSTVAPIGWKTRLNFVVSGSSPYSYLTGCDADQAGRLDGSGEYVQIWFAEAPGALGYSLKGQFTSGSFSGSFNVQQSVNGTNWTDLHIHTALAGSCTNFTDTPAAASRYIRFYFLNKVSGYNVELDNISLAKAPVSPKPAISVLQGNNGLANGSTYVNGNTAATVFKLRNLGNSQPLLISSINITGVNAGDYSIAGAPTSVAAADSTSFTLNFSAGAPGSRFAKMTINSNDSNNAAFEVNLYGIGGSYPSLPAAQPTNLMFSNVKPWTFNVSWTDPVSKPEYYLALRKNAAITETPANAHTYLKGDLLGSAQVAYAGPAAGFKPDGIIAYDTYYYTVFSYNGPKGYENYLNTAPLNGNITTSGSHPGTYYSGISSSTTSFITDLHNRINPHDTIFYSNYNATIIGDFYAKDTVQGQKVVYCVYTHLPYVYYDPFVFWSGSNSGTLTREHTFAQSWMPSNVGNPNWPNDAATGRHELPEYNDQHHLFPADQLSGNQKRSNYPFGEVVGTPTYVSPTGLGKLGHDSTGHIVWEPRDQHKGDLARAMMYMAVCYNGVNGKSWAFPSSISGTIPYGQSEAVIKKWHFQDPPDAFEIARHEYIASIQHNRNPFIDSMLWANKIDFRNMSYIGNPVPGITITSPVGGEHWLIGIGTEPITWTSVNVDSVKIELLVNDTFAALISAGEPASAGMYSWTIPFTVPSTTHAKVRLSDLHSPSASTSPAEFNLELNNAIVEESLENRVALYPNPSNGSSVLSIGTAVRGEASIQVFDLSGRIVKEIRIKGQNTPVELQAAGAYILRLQVNGQTAYRKLMVN